MDCLLILIAGVTSAATGYGRASLDTATAAAGTTAGIAHAAAQPLIGVAASGRLITEAEVRAVEAEPDATPGVKRIMEAEATAAAAEADGIRHEAAMRTDPQALPVEAPPAAEEMRAAEAELEGTARLMLFIP